MTLDNLQKVLAALQTSSPHRTAANDRWENKSSDWFAKRAESIKIVQDEIKEKFEPKHELA